MNLSHKNTDLYKSMHQTEARLLLSCFPVAIKSSSPLIRLVSSIYTKCNKKKKLIEGPRSGTEFHLNGLNIKIANSKSCFHKRSLLISKCKQCPELPGAHSASSHVYKLPPQREHMTSRLMERSHRRHSWFCRLLPWHFSNELRLHRAVRASTGRGGR